MAGAGLKPALSCWASIERMQEGGRRQNQKGMHEKAQTPPSLPTLFESISFATRQRRRRKGGWELHPAASQPWQHVAALPPESRLMLRSPAAIKQPLQPSDWVLELGHQRHGEVGAGPAGRKFWGRLENPSTWGREAPTVSIDQVQDLPLWSCLN